MSKHTPGPWSADKWATGYTVSSDLEHYSVCHLEECNNDEANAHLIAAAPELLAALVRLIDCATENPAAYDERFEVHFKNARAAIAKARGQ